MNQELINSLLDKLKHQDRQIESLQEKVKNLEVNITEIQNILIEMNRIYK